MGSRFYRSTTILYATDWYATKYDTWRVTALSTSRHETKVDPRLIAFVSFTAVKCKPYDPPINGLVACEYSDIYGGEACTPQCSSLKEFARIPAQFYICQTVGTWFVWDIRPTVELQMPWPDCTGTSM